MNIRFIKMDTLTSDNEAGLLRKLHGKFRLTKKGGNLLEEQAYGTIYYKLF